MGSWASADFRAVDLPVPYIIDGDGSLVWWYSIGDGWLRNTDEL